MPYSQDKLWQVKLSYAISGNRLSTTMHFAADDGPVTGMAAELGNNLEAAMMPLWLACVSLEVKFQNMYVRCMDRGRVWPFTNTYGTKVGTQTGESLPSNIAMVIQLRQAEISGRTNNRLFISGVPEEVVVNSVLDSAYIVASAAPLAAYLRDTVIAGTLSNYRCCCVHKVGPGPHPTYEGHPITQAFVDESTGSQRRRTTELRQFHP